MLSSVSYQLPKVKYLKPDNALVTPLVWWDYMSDAGCLPSGDKLARQPYEKWGDRRPNYRPS